MVHNKKLLALWKSDRSRSPDCLLNLSSIKLSLLEENVLRLGLKHHILPNKLDENNLRVEIEKLIFNVTNEYNVVISSDFKEKLRAICKSFVSQANGLCSTRQNQLFHKTVRGLLRNESIKVCRYDKGNGVVVLNNSDYFEKLDTIVLDEEKFQKIAVDVDLEHPVIKNENSIKRYLSNNVKKFVDKSTFDKIIPSGSQPGKLYGLCKVHKANHPMRPVISMVGTAEYRLAKYLDTFIKPCINTNHTVSSTTEFIEKLQSFNLTEGDFSVSFDVCSLYTNIPLEETIKLVAEKVFSSSSTNVPPFSKKTFIKLLTFATSGMFLYNNSLYKQVDGVAMGSPLGPSLANFFLGHLEQHNIFNKSGINPKLYVRYVDDIFAVFDKNVKFQPFLDHINHQHGNIKFTVEESVNNVLAFLDTSICIKGNNFESCVYRKSTNTDVLLNFDAVCPVTWKKGVILGALNRAKIICSTRELFLSEVEKLKTMFFKNGYSMRFFDNVFSVFDNRQLNVESTKRDIDYKCMFKIPFVGLVSHEFKKKVINLFFHDLGVEIFPIFKSCKLSGFFSLKSQTPKELIANAVYKYTCLCDTSLTYIGKTKRHLAVRSEEHLRFERDLPKSEIKTHLKTCVICQNSSLDNFEVLKKCMSDHEAKINEAMIVKKRIPELNKNLFNSGCLFTLKVYN